MERKNSHTCSLMYYRDFVVHYQSFHRLKHGQVLIYPSITQSQVLVTWRKKSFFKSIVGKGENAGNQHFFLFPQCFLLFLSYNPVLETHLICPSQSYYLNNPNISFVKGLCKLVYFEDN